MKLVAFLLLLYFLAPLPRLEEAPTPAEQDAGLSSAAPVSPVKEVREEDESIESGGTVEEETQEETTKDDAAVTGSVCVSNEALQSQPVEAMRTLEVLVKHTRERVGENIAREECKSSWNLIF